MDSILKPIKIQRLTPIHDRVIVTEMKFNERYSSGGIFLPSDDMKVQGVHPRWGKVYAVGPEQTEIKVGQYVLVEHGRWTRGVKIIDSSGSEVVIRMIDPTAIMLVSDEEVLDENLGTPI
jgi:co-chaperonin GroES (HSP10)